MSKRTLLAVTASLAVMAFAEIAHAQASASPYTSATRYDVLGRVTGTISPNSPAHGYNAFVATRSTYDAAGRVTKVESGTLSAWQSEAVAPASWSGFTVYKTVEYTYDASHAKLTERVLGTDLNPYALTQYSYDGAGRLECAAVRMNPSAFGSLPLSACTLGTQGANGPDRIAKNVYDAAGQLVQTREGVGTAVEAAEVTRTYTQNGQLKYVIDAGGSRAELRYDGHDRQVRWVFPSATGAGGGFNDSTPVNAVATAGALNESDYEEYAHDANGNRTSLRKRDGSTLGYSYDLLNRMTVKVVPGATTHTRDVYYSYDLRGLITSVRFDSTVGEGVVLAYDGLGRKTSETLSMDGVTRSIGSGYDRNGNRTRVTYSDTNYVDAVLDGLDRPYASYLNASAPMIHPWYDAAGRRIYLHGWTTSAANWLHWQGFTYDAVSRLATTGNVFAGGSYNSTTTFGYNPASQITSSARTNDAYAFTAHVNADRGYTSNGLNQYSAVASSSFGYDANGNLTSDGTQTFTYDVENRLVARSGGGTTAAMRYDPLGRLYETYGSDTGTTRFLYSGDELVAEYDSSGNLLRRYVHGGGGGDDPQVWFEGSGVSDGARRYLYADERGSVVAVTDSSGNVSYINAYDEYGIPGSAGNDISTRGRFRYTGQAWIPEMGMYYYKARMYSPTLGRFMQTDPIGYDDQFNIYAYVGNDPINLVDFTGKCASIGDADVQSACLEARSEAIESASEYLDTQSVSTGAVEPAYIATFNEDTGQVTVRVGSEAGIQSNGEVQFTNPDGTSLVAEPDGRILVQTENGGQTATSDIILVTGHGHPDNGDGWKINSVNAMNDSSLNLQDRKLSQVAPAVIKGPSQTNKRWHNGRRMRR